jgi:hypothetical protein
MARGARGGWSGPYGGAAQLTAAPEAEQEANQNIKGDVPTKVLLDPRPAAAHAPWLKPLGSYDRRERCEFQVARFG